MDVCKRCGGEGELVAGYCGNDCEIDDLRERLETMRLVVAIDSHDIRIESVGGGSVVRIGFRDGNDEVEVFMDPDQAGEIGRELVLAEQATMEETMEEIYREDD